MKLTVNQVSDLLREAEKDEWISAKDKHCKPLIKWLHQQVRKLFDQQKENLLNLSAFILLESKDELSQWMILLDQSIAETLPDFIDFISESAVKAFAAGGDVVAAKFDIDFELANPRAEAYLRDATDRAITGINETTRKRVNTVVRAGIAEGLTQAHIAAQIEELFDGFSQPPIVPNRNFRTRADAISVFEIGDKYEGGMAEAIQQLEDSGTKMLKAWLTIGDDRVRQAHRANQDQGYISFKKAFSSGHKRSPTDPGCRCTMLYLAA